MVHKAGVAKSQKTILVHGQPFRKFNLSVAELHLSVNVYINYKRIYCYTYTCTILIRPNRVHLHDKIVASFLEN